MVDSDSELSSAASSKNRECVPDLHSARFCLLAKIDALFELLSSQTRSDTGTNARELF